MYIGLRWHEVSYKSPAAAWWLVGLHFCRDCGHRSPAPRSSRGEQQAGSPCRERRRKQKAQHRTCLRNRRLHRHSALRSTQRSVRGRDQPVRRGRLCRVRVSGEELRRAQLVLMWGCCLLSVGLSSPLLFHASVVVEGEMDGFELSMEWGCHDAVSCTVAVMDVGWCRGRGASTSHFILSVPLLFKLTRNSWDLRISELVLRGFCEIKSLKAKNAFEQHLSDRSPTSGSSWNAGHDDDPPKLPASATTGHSARVIFILLEWRWRLTRQETAEGQ